MLPGFRFLIGATLAVALLGVVAVGLESTVQLSRLAKLSPLDAPRSLAYAERRDWKRAVDPALMRVFEAVAQSSSDHSEAVIAISAPEPAVAAAAPSLTVEDETADVPSPKSVSQEPAAAVDETPAPANAASATMVLPVQEPIVAASETAVAAAADAHDGRPAETLIASPVAETPSSSTMDTASGDASAQAPSAQASLARPVGKASQQSAEDDGDQQADQPVGRLASVPDAANSREDRAQSEQPDGVAPHVAPLNVLPRPMPKLRRMREVHIKANAPRGKAVKSGVIRPRIAKARTAKIRTARGKLRARPQVVQPAAPMGPQDSWTGYRVTPQTPTSWGWSFKK